MPPQTYAEETSSAYINYLCSFHKEDGAERLRRAGGVKGVAGVLNVQLENGLWPDQVKPMQERYGKNLVPERSPRAYLMYLKDAFGDFTIRLLCVCALLSIVIALAFQQDEELSWIEGVAIIGTVAAVCNIQAMQDFSKERAFRRLNAESSKSMVRVIRGGQPHSIVKYDIVVGDCLSIGVGDVLEADGVLISGNDIECDESALTGEPEDIHKDVETVPMLFSGSSVKSGTGSMLVTAVGMHSVSGRITALVRGQHVKKDSEDAALLPVKQNSLRTPDKDDHHDGVQLELEEKPQERELTPEQLIQRETSKPSDMEASLVKTLGRTTSRPSVSSKSSRLSRSSRQKREDDWRTLTSLSSSAASQEELEEVIEEDFEEHEGSVLRVKLDAMVGKLAIFAFSSAGIAASVMLARFIISNYAQNGNDWSWQSDPDRILTAVVTGIAIVVVAVPEGLPLAVTLALTLSMKKMQKDNNLVKHMDATETMGSATTICSDKTGTLTQNRMTVARVCVGDIEVIGEHSKDRTCGKLTLAHGKFCEEVQALITETICLASDATAEIRWDVKADRWEQTGNKTDCALLAFSHDIGVKAHEVRNRPEYWKDKLEFGLKLFPFSSNRKRSGIAVPLTDDPRGPCRLFMKGASEIILSLSSHQITPEGFVMPVDATRQRMVTATVDRFASNAMRTLALAYRDFPEPPDWDAELDLSEASRLTGQVSRTFKAEVGLTLVAIMGIHDPVREGVPHAIQQCNLAGIDVRMVTGDHRETAVAIAKECGILREGIDYTCNLEGILTEGNRHSGLVHEYTAMTGEDFRNLVLANGQLDQDAFDGVWPHLRVLARSSPEDKHTLVSGLCESQLCFSSLAKGLNISPDRQVVAVTGDGTNDAPALRRAHVGFAMKITGTRVAQDAADILLLDDNFESVVKAAMWGRNVYDSIAKFLQFQLTVNVSAVSISLLGAIAVGEAPLSVVQMLWVNLIMDSLGALALAAEPPTEDLLHRPPYGKNKPLISFEIGSNIIGQALFQLAALVVLFFFGAGPHCPSDQQLDTCDWQEGGLLNIESGIGRGHLGNPTAHYTVIFNAFVLMQLFNWINCRKLHHEFNVFSGIQRNGMFCVIWVVSFIVQCLFVQGAAIAGGEGVNKVFKTRGLGIFEWSVCLALGLLSLVWQPLIVVIAKCFRPLCTRSRDKSATQCDACTPKEVTSLHTAELQGFERQVSSEADFFDADVPAGNNLLRGSLVSGDKPPKVFEDQELALKVIVHAEDTDAIEFQCGDGSDSPSPKAAKVTALEGDDPIAARYAAECFRKMEESLATRSLHLQLARWMGVEHAHLMGVSSSMVSVGVCFARWRMKNYPQRTSMRFDGDSLPAWDERQAPTLEDATVCTEDGPNSSNSSSDGGGLETFRRLLGLPQCQSSVARAGCCQPGVCQRASL